jgi:ubiquinone/menaquinone biosynthesis C-methylase UbiE
MVDCQKEKRLDYTIADVIDIYSGPVGVLWQMLMGDQIHVGGESETEALASRAGITSESRVLDVCSALGAPARQLASRYGCTVIGLDATEKMVDMAEQQTQSAGLSDRVSFQLGNALDMPFKEDSFTVVWGQDAWCYVSDKDRLVEEAFRVLEPGGTIAFTDWLQVGPMAAEEWADLNGFMAFPYIETLEGYQALLQRTGYEDIETEDLSEDFARHCHHYLDMLRTELKDGIIEGYGVEMYKAAEDGLKKWTAAAEAGKVGRGSITGRKPQ